MLNIYNNSTELSALINFRYDNLNALINLENNLTVTHGISTGREIIFEILFSRSKTKTKIDTDGR